MIYRGFRNSFPGIFTYSIANFFTWIVSRRGFRRENYVKFDVFVIAYIFH